MGSRQGTEHLCQGQVAGRAVQRPRLLPRTHVHLVRSEPGRLEAQGSIARRRVMQPAPAAAPLDGRGLLPMANVAYPTVSREIRLDTLTPPCVTLHCVCLGRIRPSHPKHLSPSARCSFRGYPSLESAAT